jgi:hypothetical protein
MFGIALPYYINKPIVAKDLTTSSYENSYMGIKFQYPTSWNVNELITADGPDCFVYPFGVYHFCEVAFDGSKNCCAALITVTAHKLDECKCNSLREFVKWSYGAEPVFVGSSVITDSPVTVSGSRSAWEMESDMVVAPAPRTMYSLWIINNNMGYFISLAAEAGKLYDNYLKDVKEMINTIEFVPVVITTEKTPSFMN